MIQQLIERKENLEKNLEQTFRLLSDVEKRMVVSEDADEFTRLTENARRLRTLSKDFMQEREDIMNLLKDVYETRSDALYAKIRETQRYFTDRKLESVKI